MQLLIRAAGEGGVHARHKCTMMKHSGEVVCARVGEICVLLSMSLSLVWVGLETNLTTWLG